MTGTDPGSPAVRHVALFRWVEGATAEQVAAVEQALRALPAAIPELRSYHVGSDLGLLEGTWDFAVVAELDSVDAWRTYREHPAHQAALRDHIAPISAERISVQFAR